MLRQGEVIDKKIFQINYAWRFKSEQVFYWLMSNKMNYAHIAKNLLYRPNATLDIFITNWLWSFIRLKKNILLIWEIQA